MESCACCASAGLGLANQSHNVGKLDTQIKYDIVGYIIIFLTTLPIKWLVVIISTTVFRKDHAKSSWLSLQLLLLVLNCTYFAAKSASFIHGLYPVPRSNILPYVWISHSKILTPYFWPQPCPVVSKVSIVSHGHPWLGWFGGTPHDFGNQHLKISHIWVNCNHSLTWNKAGRQGKIRILTPILTILPVRKQIKNVVSRNFGGFSNNPGDIAIHYGILL